MKDSIQAQFIEARRHQILDAAAKVFAEKGFHPTTIKEIAREAGVADGTIYNYFENKTALLLGILDRMKQTALQNAILLDPTEVDFRGFMRAYLQQPLMALRADNFALFRVVMSEIMVNQELRDVYRQKILEPTLTLAEPLFERWVEEQVIKPVDIKLMMRVLSGVVLGLMIEHIMGDPTLESRWDELPNFLANVILDGIGND
jgi:AcrR family transcriptional regulator